MCNADSDDYYEPIDLDHNFDENDILDEWVRKNETSLIRRDVWIGWMKRLIKVKWENNIIGTWYAFVPIHNYSKNKYKEQVSLQENWPFVTTKSRH